LLIIPICLPAYGQKKQRIKQIYHTDAQNPAWYTDSMVFYYSGNRGSVFNFNNFEGARYGFRADNFTGLTIMPSCHMPRPVRDVYVTDAQPDSMLRYLRAPAADTPYLSHTIYATYTGDTLPADIRTGRDSLLPKTRNLHLYDALGNTTFTCNLVRNGVSNRMDTMHSRHVQYDSRGRVVSDTFRVLGAGTITTMHYEYDAMGRVISFTQNGTANYPPKMEATYYTYNTAGSITKEEYKLLDEDVWMPQGRQEYEYDGQNRLVTHTAYDANGQTTYLRHVQYNTAGDPYIQDMTYYNNGQVYTCEWTEFYFNEYHNPDSAITWARYCTDGFTQKETTIYTYETYGEDTLKLTGRRTPFIYPLPARNAVHIRWHRDYRKTPLQIKLYNIAGQEIRTYYISRPAAEDTIATDGLPAGTYLLRINTGTGNEYVYSGNITVL